MARIRTVKPEFWDDEKLATLPRDVRLLYIGMWNFSDDFGVIKANPIWIKSKVFPFDDIQLSQFKKWLEMLERPGFNSPGGSVAWAIPFSANGEAFYYLSNFSRHQRVDKPSTFNRNPEPPKDIRDWKPRPIEPVQEASPNPPGALQSVLGIGSGEVIGNGNGEVRDLPPAVASEASARPKNLIWDSLCFVFQLTPVTKGEKSRLGKSVREFTEKGANPAEIALRADRYRSRWPNIAFTPEALLKHWDMMGQEQTMGINGVHVSKSQIHATMQKVLQEHRNESDV